MSDNPTKKVIQERSTSSKYRRSDTAWTFAKRPPTRNRVFPPKTFKPCHRRAMVSHSDSTLESTRMSPGNSLTSSSDILLDSSKNISDLPLSSLSSVELPSEHQISMNRHSRTEPKFISRLKETPTRDKQDKPIVRDELAGKMEAGQGTNKTRNFVRGDRVARCRGDAGKPSKFQPVALPRANSRLCREKPTCEKKSDDVKNGDGRGKQKQKTTSLRRIGIRVSSLDGSRKPMECKKAEVDKREAGRCHSDVELSKSLRDTNECKNQIEYSPQQSPCQKLCEAPNLAERRTCDSHVSGQKRDVVDVSSKAGAPADGKQPKPLVKLKGVGHQNPMSLAYKMSKEVVPEPQPMLEVKYNAPTMWTNTHSEAAAPQNVLIKKKLFKFIVKKPTQPANSKPSKVAETVPKCPQATQQVKDLPYVAIQKPAIDIPTKKVSACSDHKSKCDESMSDIKKIQNSQSLQRSLPHPPVPKTPSPQPESAVERDVTTNKDPTNPMDSSNGRSDSSTNSTMDQGTPSRGLCPGLIPVNKSMDKRDVVEPTSHAGLKISPPDLQSYPLKKTSTEATPVVLTDTDTQAEIISVPSVARKSFNEISERIQTQSSASNRPTKSKTNEKTNTSASASDKYPKPDRWRAKHVNSAANKQNTIQDGVVGQRTNGNDSSDARVRNKLKSRNSSAPPSDQRAAQAHQHLETSKTALVNINKESKTARSQKDPPVGRSPPKLKEQPMFTSESCPRSPKRNSNDTKHVKEIPNTNNDSGKIQANINNRKKNHSPKNAQLISDYSNGDDASKQVSEGRNVQKQESNSKDLKANNLKIEGGGAPSTKSVRKIKPSSYEASQGSLSEPRVANSIETPQPINTDNSVGKKNVELQRSRSWDQSSKKSADDDEGEVGENRRGIHSKINSEINEIVEVVLEFLTKRKEMSAQRSPEIKQETPSALMAKSSSMNLGEATGDPLITSPPTDAVQLSSITSSDVGQTETSPPQESSQQAHKFESIRTYFESQVNRLGAFRKDIKSPGYSPHRNYLRNMKSPTSEPRLDTQDVTSQSPVERKRSETSRNSKSACIQSPISLGITSNTTYSDNYEAQSRLQRLRALVPNEQGDKVEILQPPIPSARKSPIDKSFIKRRMRIGQILKSKFEHNVRPRNSSCDRSRSKSAVYLSGSDTSVSQASSSFTLKSNKSHQRDPRHEEINREKEKISCRCAAIHSILNDLKHHILLERVGQQMYTPAQIPNYDDIRLEEREFNESGKVGRTDSSYSKASTSDGVSHYSKEKSATIVTSGRPLPKPRCRIPRFVPSGSQAKAPIPLADVSCDSDYLKIIASIIKNNAILSDEQHPHQSAVEMQMCADHDRKFRNKPRESKSFIEHFCKQLVESWQLRQAPSEDTGATNREAYITHERLSKASRTSTKVYKKGGEKIEHFERNEKYHLGQGEIKDYDEINSMDMSGFLPGGWMTFSRNLPDFSKIFGEKRSCGSELKEAQVHIGDIYKESVTAHSQTKNTPLENQSKLLKQREEKYAIENRKSEKKVENSRQKILSSEEIRNKSIRELLEFAYSQKNNEDISKQIVREIYDRASRKQSDVKYKKQLREGALQLFCLLTSQSVGEESNNLEQELFDENFTVEEERCHGMVENSLELSQVDESVERSSNLQDAYTIMKAEYVERIKENQRIIDQWSLSPSNKYQSEEVESTKETIVNTRICQFFPLDENISVSETAKIEACIDEAASRDVVKAKASSKKGVTFVLPSFTAMIEDGQDHRSGDKDDKVSEAKSPPKDTRHSGDTTEGPRRDDGNHTIVKEWVVDKYSDTPGYDVEDPSAHGAALKSRFPESHETLSKKFCSSPTEFRQTKESPAISEDMQRSHLCGDRGSSQFPSSPRGAKISTKSETKQLIENDVPEPLEYVPRSFRSTEISPDTGHGKLSSPKRGEPTSPAMTSTKGDQNKLADKLLECRSCKSMYKSRLNDEGATPTMETTDENVASRNCLVDEKNLKPCPSTPQDQDDGATAKDQPLISPKRTSRRDSDKKTPDPPKDHAVVPPVRNRRSVDMNKSPESRKSTRDASPYADKKLAADTSTMVETRTEDEGVRHDPAVDDVKVPGAYKPTRTSPQIKNPTGFSPSVVVKHDEKIGNIRKVEERPEKTVEDKAENSKLADHKLAAANHNRRTPDVGKVAVDGRVQTKTSDNKFPIGTKVATIQNYETSNAFKESLDRQKSDERDKQKHKNDDSKQLPNDKPIDGDKRLDSVQIEANFKPQVHEDKPYLKTLKTSTDPRPKERLGLWAKNTLLQTTYKNGRNEEESLESSAVDKVLLSDENTDKHADECTYNLHSEEQSDKTLCETGVSEKTVHGNSIIVSEDQKEMTENSINTDTVNNAAKEPSVEEDKKLTRHTVNKNKDKEELVERTIEVRGTQTVSHQKCEPAAAIKDHFPGERKAPDKCETLFSGTEASEVDSSKGIDDLMESEIKMIVNSRIGENICCQQLDKASGVTAQDTHDVGTEMSQLSECKYGREEKVEPIDQITTEIMREDKVEPIDQKSNEIMREDKVEHIGQKSAEIRREDRFVTIGQKSAEIRREDRFVTIGQKSAEIRREDRAGPIGQKSAEIRREDEVQPNGQKVADMRFDSDVDSRLEDSATKDIIGKEPDKSTNDTRAVPFQGVNNVGSKLAINMKTASLIQGFNCNKPDNKTENLTSRRNEMLNDLRGSKSQPQRFTGVEKQNHNLNDQTNTSLFISKSRSKTLNQLDFRNPGQETGVAKLQAMNPSDPRKQFWNLKDSHIQTPSLTIPKNKPFNMVDPLNQPLDLSDRSNLPLDLSGRQCQVLDLSHPKSHQVTRKDSIYEALDLSDPRKHKLLPSGSMYKLYNQVEPMNLTLRPHDTKTQHVTDSRRPFNTHGLRSHTFNLSDHRNQVFNLQKHESQFMGQNDKKVHTLNMYDPMNQRFAPNDPMDHNLNDPRYQAFYPTNTRHPSSNITDSRRENNATGVNNVSTTMPLTQVNIFRSTTGMPSSKVDDLINTINIPIPETSPQQKVNVMQQGEFPVRCSVFTDEGKVDVLHVKDNDYTLHSGDVRQNGNKTNLVKPIAYGNPQNHVVFNQVNYPCPVYQTSPINMHAFLNQQYPVGYYPHQRQTNCMNQAFPLRPSQPQVETNFISEASLMNYLQPQNQNTLVNQMQRQADINYFRQFNQLDEQQPKGQAMFLNQAPPMNHSIASVVPPSSTTNQSQPPLSSHLSIENIPVGQPNNPNSSGFYNVPICCTQPSQQAGLVNLIQAPEQGSFIFNTTRIPIGGVSLTQTVKNPQNNANNASQHGDLQTVVKRDNTRSINDLKGATSPPDHKLKCTSAPPHFTECTSPNDTLSESCVVNQDIHADKTNSLNQISVMQLSNQTGVPITSSSVGYDACSKPNSVKFSDPLISYASHAPTSINADSKHERPNQRELSKTSVASHHLQDQSSVNSQQHRVVDSEYTCEAWRAADTCSYTGETVSYDNEYLLSDLSRYENSEFSKVADMTTQVSRSHLYVATQMSSTDTIHSLPLTHNPGEANTVRDRPWQSFDTVEAVDPSQLASSSSTLFNHQVSYSIAVECLIQNDQGYDKLELPKRVMTPIEENDMSEREASSGSTCENKYYCSSKVDPNSLTRPYGDAHPACDQRSLSRPYAMDRWEYPETLFDYVTANDSAGVDSLSSLEKQRQGPFALNRSASDCISQIPKDATSVNDVFEYPMQYRPMCLSEMQRLQSHIATPTQQQRMKPASTLFQSPETSNLRYATVFDGGTPPADELPSREPIRRMPATNFDGPGVRRSYPKPSMFNRPLAFVRPEEPLDLSDTAQSNHSSQRNSSLNSDKSLKSKTPVGNPTALAANAPKEVQDNHFYSGKQKGVCNPYTLDLMGQNKQLFPQSAYKTNNTPTFYETMGFVAQAKHQDSKDTESNQPEPMRDTQYHGHYMGNPKDAFNIQRVYNRVTDCMRTNLDQFSAGHTQKMRSKSDKRFRDGSAFSNNPDELFRQYSAPSELLNSSNIDATNCFGESPSDNLQNFPVILRSTACGSERHQNFRASSPMKSLKVKRNTGKTHKKSSAAKKRLSPCMSYSWNGSENKNASQQYEGCELFTRDNFKFGHGIHRSETGQLEKSSPHMSSKHRNINPHVAWADVYADLSSKLDRRELQSANFSMDPSLDLRVEDFYAIEDDNYPNLSCYSSIASIEGVSGSSSDMTIKSSFHSDADLSSSSEVSRPPPRTSPDRKIKHVHQPSTCTITDSMSVSESFHSCSSRLSFT